MCCFSPFTVCITYFTLFQILCCSCLQIVLNFVLKFLFFDTINQLLLSISEVKLD